MGTAVAVRPDLESVRGLATQGGTLPVWREVLADMETPVSAYLRVGGGSGSFLLESVEGGEQLGRYSFVGFAPSARIELRDGIAVVEQADGRREIPFVDPLAMLDELVGRRGSVRLPGLPRFVGGAVGYLSYELARHLERLPIPARDPLGLPLGHFLVVET